MTDIVTQVQHLAANWRHTPRAERSRILHAAARELIQLRTQMACCNHWARLITNHSEERNDPL